MPTLRTMIPPIRERIISSFDYQDVVQNRSYVMFYAGITSGSGGLLLGVTFNPVSKFLSKAITTTYDFDITVTSNFAIQGLCLLNLTYGMVGDSGDSPKRTVTPTCYVKKVSGGVTTTLATMAGTEATTFNEFIEACLSATITRTQFKIGDTMRLEITMTVGGSDHGEFFLCADPTNDVTTGTYGDIPDSNKDSKLRLWLPFVPKL